MVPGQDRLASVVLLVTLTKVVSKLPWVDDLGLLSPPLLLC